MGRSATPAGGGAIHPITFLWTVPRTVSTTFERMMSERGDHTVLDEPFSRHYYFGPDRRSDRYDEDLPDCAPEQLLEQIEKAAVDRPVFVKDMAYQASVVLEPEVLGGFRNCFLVRDPAATLRSLDSYWPDFTDDETGWAALDRAADVVAGLGQPLVVLEAARLCDDPAGVVSRWCEAMDLDFREDALRWEPGMREEWGLWEQWHASTSQGTGFDRLDDPRPPPGDDEPRLQRAYREALPVYERLAALAL